MSKPVFYDFYFKRPPKVNHKNDNSTTFVSQSEVKTSALSYQLKMYGMDSLASRMEEVRSKFGYADTTNCSDFTDIQNRYVKAVEYFEALPSEIRRKFADRPDVFYENVLNDKEIATGLGFLKSDVNIDTSDKVELPSSSDVSVDTSVANTSGQPQSSLD